MKKIIAITGLPGSGKSLVLNVFNDLLFAKNVKIFSVDEMISKIYQNSVLLKNRFKKFEWFDCVFDYQNDRINKNSLKKKIIENQNVLKNLESVLHPIVKQKIIELIKLYSENQDTDYLIFEVPLLFESKMENLFDLTIYIEAELEIRKKRIFDRIDENLHEIFLKSHFSNEKKKKLSNFCIQNNFDSRENLALEIKNFIKKIL